MPKGGGAIRGMGEKFSANPVTGTGSMSVPILTSPGRVGFGPQLSLSYDSGAGNGPFGLGWSLSLPSIVRKTDKGLPQYLDDAESDTFVLAGSEDLVPELDDQGLRPDPQLVTVYGKFYQVRCYRPRIEGLFARIECWRDTQDPANVFWRSLSRDNITTWFGRAPQSRVVDPDDPARVFQWLPCETHDDKGNVVVYRYQREDGANVDRSAAVEANRPAQRQHPATYLRRIVYGNRTPFLPTLAAGALGSGLEWFDPPDQSDAWMFEVRFDYGDYPAPVGDLQPELGAPGTWPIRADPFSSHRAGFEVRTWRLCRRVLMLHHFPNDPSVGLGCLVKSTDFEYDEPTALDDPSRPGYTRLREVRHRSYQRWPNQTPPATGYAWRELPPLVFRYSLPHVGTVIHNIAARDLPNLPVGTQGSGYQWVDLEGEGLSGVICDQGGAWHYAPNRGGGRFGPSRVVAQVPATAALGSGRQQLMDLAGDGEVELVDFGGPTPGFHERDRDEGWKRHVPFASLPLIDWQDPNLRFVDLTGDGHADALVTEHDVFTWYPSLDERGFGPARRQHQHADEGRAPRLVFNDGTQTVFLADMCGDGLTDLVRIRNGNICYWPNLGYGRFGRRVTMGNAPRFDTPDQFDSKRIRLADIDGSGPVDIIYLGHSGAQLYFNRSGNSFSLVKTVPLPVATENLPAVQVADLLGNGTACLVWNSHLPADAASPVRYVELMAEGKPHLLTEVRNNLGGRTEIEYTPSTRYYLDDLAAGTPWVTRLPFPVHCVSRVTVHDLWRGSRFSSRTSYHHGHFDGTEREFRGFGRVEQLDEESYTDPLLDQPPVKTITWFHTGAALDRRRILNQFAAEYFPQRYARRLHDPADTDPFFERALPEPELPSNLPTDEWREALRACKGMVLRQEVYELDAADLRAPNPKHTPVRLFSAATHNCRIQRLQARGANRHAVFLVTESEALSYHYELPLPDDGSLLKPDPRITHTLTLRHDELGNPQQSVSIGYGRWKQGDYGYLPRPALAHEVQAETHIAYSEIRYTEDVRVAATGPAPNGSVPALRHRRLRLPCETLTYELANIPRRDSRYHAPSDFERLDLSEEYGHCPGEVPPGTAVACKPYHDTAVGNTPQKRLVEHARTLYFDDARDTTPPANPLPFRRHGPRGLKYQDYKLALTRALLDAVFGTPQAADPLADKLAWPAVPAQGGNAAKSGRDLLDDSARSGYSRGEDLERLLAPHVAAADLAGQYWMRSGVAGFTAQPAAAFFLPDRYTDPFEQRTRLTYGPHHLYVAQVEDAVGNLTTVAQFDHRVLAPREMIDANGNHTEGAYDILGLPVALAIKGKPQPDGTWQGGDLGGFDFNVINPSPKAVADFCTAHTLDEAQARGWLRRATTRFVYHHGETRDAAGAPTWMQRMAGACAIRCETHAGELPSGQLTRLQVALECTDGSGAVLMQKAQAEPETAGGPLRWLVNGHTVLNNKGKPVRQFEPAFSPRFGCEAPGMNGVSTTLYYDAPGRVVRTEMPDGTLSRVVFTPWQVEAWDVGDTVLESAWVRRKGRDTLPLASALAVGIDGLYQSDPDQRAGWLARQHANTPARTILDSLGREVVSVAHNRQEDPNGAHAMAGVNWKDDFNVTFTKLDAEGKPLWIRDARGNLVMQYITPPKPVRAADEPDPTHPEALPGSSAPCYDIAGNLLHQHSMDAGSRWMLMDAAGQPLLAWDSNERTDDNGTTFQEHRLYRTDHDALRRPTAQWLRVWQRARPQAGVTPQPFQPQAPVMQERLEYRDGPNADPENLNGQLVRHYDASGLVRTVRRKYTGQVQEVHRRLVAVSKASVTDWQAEPTEGDTRLEADTYIQITDHDALGRTTRLYNWHRDITFGPGSAEQPTPGATNRVAVYVPEYNERGLLKAERLHLRASKATQAGRVDFTGNPDPSRSQPAIQAIAYNAKGQKTELTLGNGTVTRYTYDPETFRLTRLYTRRGATWPGDCAGNPDAAEPARPCGVQNLRYTYDAVGNITHIRDDAQQTIWFRNSVVEPSCDYTYDALNRLVEAKGREQAGVAGPPAIPEGLWPQDPMPSDRSLRRYTQRYEYDEVGNFKVFRHIAHEAGGQGSWQRHYRTAEDSNRLLQTRIGDNHWSAAGSIHDAQYRYDPHGSMLNLGATPVEFDLRWDHRDMIRHIQLGGGGDAWYQYDSGKQRTRKFIVRDGGNVVEERLYLAGFERYRRTKGNNVVEEIESHHLFEGEQRVLLVDDVLKAQEQPGPGGISLYERTCWRYQYGNHLGSVGVELDEAARVISYEEFHPYGTSAYRLMNDAAEVRAPAKRYRYSGMETDEESGLGSHGARCYSSTIGRWLSTDPIGICGGINLWAYAADAPTRFTDRSGRCFDVWLGLQLYGGSKRVDECRNYKNAAYEYLGAKPPPTASLGEPKGVSCKPGINCSPLLSELTPDQIVSLPDSVVDQLPYEFVTSPGPMTVGQARAWDSRLKSSAGGSFDVGMQRKQRASESSTAEREVINEIAGDLTVNGVVSIAIPVTKAIPSGLAVARGALASKSVRSATVALMLKTPTVMPDKGLPASAAQIGLRSKPTVAALRPIMSGPFSTPPRPRVDTLHFNFKKTATGARLSRGDPSIGGIEVSVENGVAGFDVRSSGSPSGTDMVLSALGRLRAEGVNVQKLRGTWIAGDSVNATEFAANLRAGMTNFEAAENTWTGRLFTRLGYEVESVTSTRSQTVVMFRPRQ